MVVFYPHLDHIIKKDVLSISEDILPRMCTVDPAFYGHGYNEILPLTKVHSPSVFASTLVCFTNKVACIDNHKNILPPSK